MPYNPNSLYNLFPEEYLNTPGPSIETLQGMSRKEQDASYFKRQAQRAEGFMGMVEYPGELLAAGGAMIPGMMRQYRAPSSLGNEPDPYADWRPGQTIPDQQGTQNKIQEIIRQSPPENPHNLITNHRGDPISYPSWFETPEQAQSYGEYWKTRPELLQRAIRDYTRRKSNPDLMEQNALLRQAIEIANPGVGSESDVRTAPNLQLAEGKHLKKSTKVSEYIPEDQLQDIFDKYGVDQETRDRIKMIPIDIVSERSGLEGVSPGSRGIYFAPTPKDITKPTVRRFGRIGIEDMTHDSKVHTLSALFHELWHGVQANEIYYQGKNKEMWLDRQDYKRKFNDKYLTETGYKSEAKRAYYRELPIEYDAEGHALNMTRDYFNRERTQRHAQFEDQWRTNLDEELRRVGTELWPETMTGETKLSTPLSPDTYQKPRHFREGGQVTGPNIGPGPALVPEPVKPKPSPNYHPFFGELEFKPGKMVPLNGSSGYIQKYNKNKDEYTIKSLADGEIYKKTSDEIRNMQPKFKVGDSVKLPNGNPAKVIDMLSNGSYILEWSAPGFKNTIKNRFFGHEIGQ